MLGVILLWGGYAGWQPSLYGAPHAQALSWGVMVPAWWELPPAES